MPELPEVETVVRGLRAPLVGRTFTTAKVLWPKTVKPLTPAEFESRLPSQKVTAITRRAKYLQFQLSAGDTMFIHLKMSGNLLVEPTDSPVHKHVRAIMGLDNGHQLRFKDTRKFGRIYLTDDPHSVIGKLGPEPLPDSFTVDDFKALFAKRRGRLKPLLLNQQFIAGIGNIYADESCFIAQIDPRRQADTLSETELTRLYQAIRQALNHGIVHKGASLDAVYLGGEFQNHFQAYGRTGQPCFTCGTEISRIVLGGRSTHFCSRCQQ
ncbi:bifunctional DNA-formamidopyrimidine glycosylase/DNA-(apurinic or apyrimidinic site) lyase [Anaerolineales bacterium HSG25]|nr:bifunctional DNA-formamidopyrimidine glycosylase/DNA-(apurinic or apyrimidinic site) lyase [Anaerolineales bacterium HSG25]